MDAHGLEQEDWNYPNEPLIRDTLSRNDIARILRLERLGRRVKSTTKRQSDEKEEDDETSGAPVTKKFKFSKPNRKSPLPKRKKNRRQVPKPKHVHNLSTPRVIEKRSADTVELRTVGPRPKYMKFTPKPLDSKKLLKPKRKQVSHKQAQSTDITGQLSNNVSQRKRPSDKVELRYQASRPKVPKLAKKDKRVVPPKRRARQRWSSL